MMVTLPHDCLFFPLVRESDYDASGKAKSVTLNEMSYFFAFVRIVVGDSLKLAVVWVLLYLFQVLNTYLPVRGFAGS